MTDKTSKTTEPAAACLCGCGQPVAAGSTFRQGHDQRLRGAIRKGLADLTNPAVAEFAARHGIEAAPPKPKAEPKPKVAPKAKAATTRKARTKATAA